MRSAAIPFDFAQDDKSVVGALRMTVLWLGSRVVSYCGAVTASLYHFEMGELYSAGKRAWLCHRPHLVGTGS
jgi:hypothetical protein